MQKKIFLLVFLFLEILNLRIDAQVGKVITPSNAGKTWAVIIGISKYENIRGLNYADKDAQAFYDYLVNTAGGPQLNRAQVKLMLNENAKSFDIYGALDWLKESVKESDRVIFYFSGHGDVEKKTADQNAFLLAYNSPKAAYITSGTVAVNYLQRYLKQYIDLNKAKDVIIIVDACRSGALAGGTEGVQLTSQALGQNRDMHIIKILSAQENELSIEGTKWGGGRGVFSYYLIKGLEGQANLNNDNQITVAELAAYLPVAVADATGNLQHPEIDGKAEQVLFPFDLKRYNSANLNEHEPSKIQGSLGTGIANELAPDLQAKYQLYLDYLRQGSVITDQNGKDTSKCALQIYRQLIDNPSAVMIKSSLRSSFKAALQQKTQADLNSYLRNQTEKFNSWAAYKEISYAKRLVDSGDILYNYINARTCFMENVFSDNRRTKIKWLLEALKFENDAPYALNDLGNLYSDLNKLDSAVYYLQKAIDAAPKWSIPYMNIGLQYENLKDFPNAIGFYQKSIQLDSTNADVYDDLGVYYQVANDYENALLNHKKALHFLTSKTNFNGMEALPITYYDLGYDYQKLKQNDRAVASYQKAIDIDSNYAAAHNGLGSIYQAAGDYDRALACYKKTIKLDSAYSTAYFNIGAIYLGRQSFEAAVRYYSKGLSLDTTHAGPYYYIALTYQSIGDNDKAFVNMRKSFALDSTNINCRILLGYFYVVEKDIKKGVSVLHSAMQLNPQDPVSNYNLACGWSLANEISNGLYCLRLALDEGFHSYDQLKQDGDIGNLRKTAEFNLLIKKYFPDKIK